MRNLLRDCAKLEKALLIGILLLGFSIRTFGLGSSSFWLDEVHSYERASQQSWRAVYGILLRENHAPLYDAFFLHWWMELGEKEFILRFFTVIIGTLNIAVIYALGTEAFGIQVGVLGAFFLTLSPLHIYYSREARMYVPAALLATLALFFLFKAISNYSPKYWVGYVICAVLSLYTHYFAGFTFIAVNLFLVIRSVVKKNWLLLRSLLLTNVAIALLFAPWLPTFWFQLKSNPVSWIPPMTLQSLHQTFTKFFLYHLTLGPTYLVYASTLGITLILGLFQLTKSKRAGVCSTFWKNYLFVASCVVGPIGIAVGVSLFKPLIVDRYFVMTAPVACLILAISVTPLLRHRWLFLLPLVLVIGILVSAYGVSVTQWKEDWRGVGAYVRENSMVGDVILMGSGVSMPFNYYYSGSLMRFNIPSTKKEADQRFGDSKTFKRLWIIWADRFKLNDTVRDHIVTEYTIRRVECVHFGGFYGVNVCLYANHQIGEE